MNPKNIVVLIAFVLTIAVMYYIVIRPDISDLGISIQKCSAINTDDCWHSLAHQTLNATYCYKINDSELKEHCLEHIQ